MVKVTGYEHVGIRVRDRERSLAFYASFGFRVVDELLEHDALELENAAGVRLNLIINADRDSAPPHNVLIDGPEKAPGLTHVAFTVSELDQAIAELGRIGVSLSGGPLDLGRRRVCFVRDPDGSVIELDELKETR